MFAHTNAIEVQCIQYYWLRWDKQMRWTLASDRRRAYSHRRSYGPIRCTWSVCLWSCPHTNELASPSNIHSFIALHAIHHIYQIGNGLCLMMRTLIVVHLTVPFLSFFKLTVRTFNLVCSIITLISTLHTRSSTTNWFEWCKHFVSLLAPIAKFGNTKWQHHHYHHRILSAPYWIKLIMAIIGKLINAIGGVRWWTLTHLVTHSPFPSPSQMIGDVSHHIDQYMYMYAYIHGQRYDQCCDLPW